MKNFSNVKNFNKAAEMMRSLSKNAKNEVLESYISLHSKLISSYRPTASCYPIPMTEGTATAGVRTGRILRQRAEEYVAGNSVDKLGYVGRVDILFKGHSFKSKDLREFRASHAQRFLDDGDGFYDGYDEDGLAGMLAGNDQFILQSPLFQKMKVSCGMAPSFEDAGQLIGALYECIVGSGDDVGGKINVDACRKFFQDLIITTMLLKWSKDESASCEWRHQVAKTLLSK